MKGLLMWMLYVKQAWRLIRQESLFSLIYIIGTGLSISMVMTMLIVFYIRVADLYPETNRSRMLILKCGLAKPKTSEWSNSTDGFSRRTIDACFGSLQHAETLSLMCRPNDNEKYVRSDAHPGQVRVLTKYVDEHFWEVFPFRFLAGKPFTAADVRSALPSAVISASLAQRLFGSTDVAGRTCTMDYEAFRIAGVVRDGSYALDRSFADIWIPYTRSAGVDTDSDSSGLLGDLQVCALAPSEAEVEALKEEMADRIRRYAQTLDEWEFEVYGQPDRQWQTGFRSGGFDNPDFGRIVLQYSLILFLLLFIPAVSLSGMADSRMERRAAEMGVRRAFGARTGTLMGQILVENLLFTLLGGLAGLLFSYGVVYLCRQWIMQIGQSAIDLPPVGTDVLFSPGMLINLPVFGLVVAVCLALNLLSALIPAWRASRRQIIQSLNVK